MDVPEYSSVPGTQSDLCVLQFGRGDELRLVALDCVLCAWIELRWPTEWLPVVRLACLLTWIKQRHVMVTSSSLISSSLVS